MVKRLRAARAADPSFPRVLLVHQGTIEDGERFFTKHGAEAAAIADSTGSLYDAFEIERARWSQLFGLGVLLRGAKAALGGHGVGKPVGDVRRMPGAFLVDADLVVWAQDPAHVGDHPNLAAVHAMALMLRGNAERERSSSRTV